MKSKKKYIILIALITVAIIIIIIILRSKQNTNQYIHNEGKIYGTYYTVTYLQPEGVDLQEKLEKRLREFELSLSTFNPSSIISRINKNDDSVLTDHYFETLFEVARTVSEKTNGAFDLTVAPLVNAWGFGFGNRERIEVPKVSEILPYVGYKKVMLDNHRVTKQDARIMLDASARAKGFSCDVIAGLLEEYKCRNYLVEIGGEIVCKGLNPKKKKWQVGIDTPVFETTNSTHELQAIIAIQDVGLATSGNYRQFYYLNEKKLSHTIDPRNGYPVDHNLLSVTVIAPTCIQADAYATAFMVLGKDSALQICKTIPAMDCYLIYSDENGNNQVAHTEGLKKYLLSTN